VGNSNRSAVPPLWLGNVTLLSHRNGAMSFACCALRATGFRCLLIRVAGMSLPKVPDHSDFVAHLLHVTN